MRVSGSVSAILASKGSAVWSVTPDVSVYSALELMAEKGVGALLVMDSGTLVGVVSERDYARKVILHGRASRETTVGEIMTAPPTTVCSDCEVEDAMRLMTNNRVRHLPVVDDGKVQGIVSIGDVVNWIMTSQQETIGHLASYIASA